MMAVAPLLSSDQMGVVAMYTVIFSALTTFGSLGQLSLIPKLVKDSGEASSIRKSLVISLTVSGAAMVIGIVWKNSLLLLASGSSILWIIWQVAQFIRSTNYDVSGYVRFEYAFIAVNLAFSVLYYLVFGADEYLRIVPHIVALFLLGIVSLSALKKYLHSGTVGGAYSELLHSGIFISAYSVFQWLVVFGDKLIFQRIFGEVGLGEYFVSTQILSIYLLGALALMKSFRPQILDAYLENDVRKMCFLLKLYSTFCVLGIFLVLAVYFGYYQIYPDLIITPLFIMSYLAAFFFSSMIYFIVQIVIFMERNIPLLVAPLIGGSVLAVHVFYVYTFDLGFGRYCVSFTLSTLSVLAYLSLHVLTSNRDIL